jgi:hypothetical protein
MAALLIAWGALIVAVIGRAILETRPLFKTFREHAPAAEDQANEGSTLGSIS